jgi:hypothetical protein
MKRYRLVMLVPIVTLALIVVGCQDTPTTPQKVVAPQFAVVQNSIEAALQETMAEVNAALEAQGAEYRVAIADYQSADPSFLGGTVVARYVGNKSMSSRFVPNDARRPLGSYYTHINWTLDWGELPSSMTWDEAQPPVAAAMNTWQAVPCVENLLYEWGVYQNDWGLIQWMVSEGASGQNWWLFDYTHAGWLDDLFVDMVGPDHAAVLGVTWTFIFLDGGVPSDIDADGYWDTALRETYYNEHDFDWGINPTDPDIIDIESVVLHEAGHGLSQAHFGNIIVVETPSGVWLKRAPEAVMNPFYFGNQHDLFGTDVAGHCSIWEGWPDS